MRRKRVNGESLDPQKKRLLDAHRQCHDILGGASARRFVRPLEALRDAARARGVKTAKAIRTTIPVTLLARADEAIE